MTREEYQAIPFHIRGIARAMVDNPEKDARKMIAETIKSEDEFVEFEAAWGYLDGLRNEERKA